MYLSQLTLNPRARAVRRDLADAQQLHRTIMTAFPQKPETEAGPREHFGVLHRLELSPHQHLVTVLVQSLTEPNWDALADGYLTSPARAKSVDHSYNALRAGQTLAFRLRANPTKRVKREPLRNGKDWGGKRVALTGERDPATGDMIKDADQVRTEWLQRKGADGGFRLVMVAGREDVFDLRATPEDRVFGSGQRKVFWPVLFEGHLSITDVKQFQETLMRGIGPAKAYGFGLLSLAPPQH